MASSKPDTSAGKQCPIPPDTKLRRLKLEHWRKVVSILSINNRWQDVASKIKKSSGNEFLYSPADIEALKAQSMLGASPAEAFLDHWSTSLKDQPTIQVLLNILVEAELYQAADAVSKAFLGEPIRLENAMVEIKTEDLYLQLQNKLAMKDCDVSQDTITKSQPNDTNANLVTSYTQEIGDRIQATNRVPTNGVAASHFDDQNESAVKILPLDLYRYSDLSAATENFCNISVYSGGCKIGEGAYGTVYRAFFRRKWVAIKKLNGEVDKQFYTELEVLCKYKHENLLPLLGYSSDGPYCCLVYAYMKNGCLQERLACVGNTPPISWKKRIAIAYYTACGINHLHTYGTKPLVHRDIKSANVLLDENLMPKVGDFGLVRVGSSGGSSTIALTSKVCGTQIYMPCEAFRGEVTIKVDTFSYGVVLMELLTGLAPYDPSRRGADLISFMEENCCEVEDIVELLDSRGGQWDRKIALSLYEISKMCIETRSKDRPKISEVLPNLKELLDAIK